MSRILYYVLLFIIFQKNNRKIRLEKIAIPLTRRNTAIVYRYYS